MAYSDFTLEQINEKFGVKFVENVSLFPHPQPLPVSEQFTEALQYNIRLALSIDTEKARFFETILGILAKVLNHN